MCVAATCSLFILIFSLVCIHDSFSLWKPEYIYFCFLMQCVAPTETETDKLKTSFREMLPRFSRNQMNKLAKNSMKSPGVKAFSLKDGGLLLDARNYGFLIVATSIED